MDSSFQMIIEVPLYVTFIVYVAETYCKWRVSRGVELLFNVN